MLLDYELISDNVSDVFEQILEEEINRAFEDAQEKDNDETTS